MQDEYNLIPSCHSCNSSEKRDKEFLIDTHTNPYHKSYNNNQKFIIDNDWMLKGSTGTLILNKITPPDDFMNRDLNLIQRYRLTFSEPVNELIKDYQNYQHYRESPDYSYDYSELLLRRIPQFSNEILKKDAGKMFRDVFLEIDIYDLLD